MQDPAFYDALAQRALDGQPLDPDLSRRLLDDDTIDLLPLVHAAYRVRFARWGKTVQVHVINNAQNGRCPEDCSYCSQARTSDEPIADYPMKSEEEILDEARRAYEAGAHRYCMVFAGRGPGDGRTQRLADLVRQIKSRYANMEVCVSAGLLDDQKAKVLADAGLDRYNHNLNTSPRNYAKICTTHTYQDRVDTLAAARNAGMECCSGLIVGMGETRDELIDLAMTFRRMDAKSIPVNFLLPFEGTHATGADELTPEYCLRVLCLFRLANPTAEVRVAAGREVHFRSLQVMSLYPANSLFLDGYLNSRGDAAATTLQMLADAGFKIESDHDLSAVLGRVGLENLVELNVRKSERDLHPTAAT